MRSLHQISPLPLAALALLGCQAEPLAPSVHSLPGATVALLDPPPLKQVRSAFGPTHRSNATRYLLQGSMVDAAGLPLDTPLDISVEVSPNSSHRLKGMSWGGDFRLAFQPRVQGQGEEEVTVNLVVQDAHGLGEQRFEEVTLSATTPFDLGELYLEPMWITYPDPLLEGILRDSLGNVPIGAQGILAGPNEHFLPGGDLERRILNPRSSIGGLVDLRADGSFRVFGPPEATELRLVFGAPNHENLEVLGWSDQEEPVEMTLGRQILAKGQLVLPTEMPRFELGAYSCNPASSLRRGLELGDSGQFETVLSEEHNRIQLRGQTDPLPAFELAVNAHGRGRIELEPAQVEGQILELDLAVSLDGEPAAGLRLNAARSAEGRFLGGWKTNEAGRLSAPVWRGLDSIWVTAQGAGPVRLNLAALPETLELKSRQDG